MPTKYDPVSLDNHDSIKRVEKEISDKRELNAILLTYGFLEAFLHQLFMFELGSTKKALKSLDNYLNSDGVNLYSLSNILLVIHKIDEEVYKSLIEFNKKRNDYAHNLITKDMDKENETLNKIAEDGVNLLKKIIKIYEEDIERRGSKI